MAKADKIPLLHKIQTSNHEDQRPTHNHPYAFFQWDSCPSRNEIF